MQFAVACDNMKDIAQHTGRCAGFSIFDVTEGGGAKPVAFRPNPRRVEACSDEHGHGEPCVSHIGALELLADCCALVTGGLGRRLEADLLARGIDVCVCDVDNVGRAAALFAAGRLESVPGGTCGC